MEYQKDIALIFFSRTESDEARHKLWFKDLSKSQKLAHVLIEKAKTIIQSSGIPVYHYHEKKQRGDSFGEKIANAYQEVFDLGYQQVISVGNDCSKLENINWQEISHNLTSGNSVLGADSRGGAYLIGIQRASFDKLKFEKLSWQKNTLYSELKNLCEIETSVKELSRARDFNTFHDLLLFSKVEKSVSNLGRIILYLLKPFTQNEVEINSKEHQFYIFKDSPLRAPPFYL